MVVRIKFISLQDFYDVCRMLKELNADYYTGADVKNAILYFDTEKIE